MSINKEFTAQDLSALDLTFNQPFRLSLKENDVIECEKILRMIPKNRIVSAGMWQDRDIVAKLFLNPRHFERQIEREIAGIQSLQQFKVPTPAILGRSATPDNRVQVLILERIMEAKSLHDVWEERYTTGEEFSPTMIADIVTLLKAVIIEIATQHVLGLVQQDLHFKNFLLTDKVIYTLDGAQLQQCPFLLPRKPSMKNLALFLSQLGAGAEALQETLFRHYAKARGWTLKQEDSLEMFFLIKQWDRVRWEKFEKKIWRNATQFVQLKRWTAFGVYDRQFAGPGLEEFLAQPEVMFDKLDGQLLKAGDSATVKRIRLDGRDYVIKRYNLKSMFHALRRCLRPTRANACWRFAHKLNLFHVLNAKPVAFIEKRVLGLRGKSFLITEYVSDENAAQYIERHADQPQKVSEMIKRTTTLIKSLLSIEVTHGDLKITNILVNQDAQPVLIDLDGAAEHVSLSGLRKVFEKEWQRFLRNFADNPALQQRFIDERYAATSSEENSSTKMANQHDVNRC